MKNNKNGLNNISIFIFLCYNDFGDKMKQKKDKRKKQNNSVFSTDNEMAKLVLLIVIVAIAFAIFYVITLFVVNKNEKSEATEEIQETTIQYEKILVSSILTKQEKEYYVLVYKKDDKYLDTYKNYLSYYKMAKTDALPYYYVELDSQFNKQFVSSESNLNVEQAKDLRFSQTTLMRIKDKKIASTYEGKDNITGKLSRMTK